MADELRKLLKVLLDEENPVLARAQAIGIVQSLLAAQPGLSEGQVREAVHECLVASCFLRDGKPRWLDSPQQVEERIVSALAASQAAPQEPPPTTPVSTEADAGTMKDGIFTPAMHKGVQGSSR